MSIGSDALLEAIMAMTLKDERWGPVVSLIILFWFYWHGLVWSGLVVSSVFYLPILAIQTLRVVSCVPLCLLTRKVFIALYDQWFFKRALTASWSGRRHGSLPDSLSRSPSHNKEQRSGETVLMHEPDWTFTICSCRNTFHIDSSDGFLNNAFLAPVCRMLRAGKMILNNIYWRYGPYMFCITVF